MLTFLENQSLQSYNTLAINVQSRWWVSVDAVEQLAQALAFAQARTLPVLLLGAGSNVVLADNFTGLTIVIKIAGKPVVTADADEVLLTVGAGQNWHQLVMWCVEQDYYGLENLALIPGTVGAAPIQNIGAYGVELSDRLESVEVMDRQSGECYRLSRQACQLGYRDSVFKQALKDKVVITHITLRLALSPRWVLSYPALQSLLDKRSDTPLSLAAVAQAVIDIRQSKLPDPAVQPNAGSFFKNPIVDQSTYERLKSRYPALVAFEQPNHYYKLAAGWLLDNAGWRGKSIDGIGMHDQQALVLVNPTNASGQAVVRFAKQVQRDIADKYQVNLEIEPRVYTEVC